MKNFDIWLARAFGATMILMLIAINIMPCIDCSWKQELLFRPFFAIILVAAIRVWYLVEKEK